MRNQLIRRKYTTQHIGFDNTEKIPEPWEKHNSLPHYIYIYIIVMGTVTRITHWFNVEQYWYILVECDEYIFITEEGNHDYIMDDLIIKNYWSLCQIIRTIDEPEIQPIWRSVCSQYYARFRSFGHHSYYTSTLSALVAIIYCTTVDNCSIVTSALRDI